MKVLAKIFSSSFWVFFCVLKNGHFSLKVVILPYFSQSSHTILLVLHIEITFVVNMKPSERFDHFGALFVGHFHFSINFNVQFSIYLNPFSFFLLSKWDGSRAGDNHNDGFCYKKPHFKVRVRSFLASSSFFYNFHLSPPPNFRLKVLVSLRAMLFFISLL